MQNAECRVQNYSLHLVFFYLRFCGGGDDGIRTHDPLLAGQVLSQLSYTPIYVAFGKWYLLRRWYHFVMISFRMISSLSLGLPWSLSWQWDFAFSPKRSFKIEQRIERTLTKPSSYVAYTIVMYGRFSIERRWSSRTFRYGYLVTT